MKQLNVKKYLIASMVVFIFIAIFDFVFHGKIMSASYEATPQLWRAKTEMKCVPMILGQLLLAFVLTFVFTRGYEKKGIGEGVRFGVLMGLLLSTTSIIWYAVQPLPANMVACWVVGGIAQMVGAGAILATVYKS